MITGCVLSPLNVFKISTASFGFGSVAVGVVVWTVVVVLVVVVVVVGNDVVVVGLGVVVISVFVVCDDGHTQFGEGLIIIGIATAVARNHKPRKAMINVVVLVNSL